MIYYICALQCEAVPFIRRLNLKKNPAYTRMDVFENENSTVMVAGSGILNSAMSVTELFASGGVSAGDFIVNVGICGYMGNRNLPFGTALICNMIKSEYNGRKYYPDMIYKSPFEEYQVITYNNAVHDGKGRGECLADMEAAGVYEGAIRFVKTSQIAFIKIVSDYCDGNFPSKNQVESYIDENADDIIKWAESVYELINSTHKAGLTAEEELLMNATADRLRYSVTRRNQLKNQLIYEKIIGKDIVKIMEDM